jgi:broad specificity phosphatase PhoE
VLVSSDEPKALSTARPAVLRHRLELESLRELREVQRPAVRIPDYPAAVQTYLGGGNRDRQRPTGWEPRAAAEERVFGAITGLLERCSEPTVAVVSHGLLLTLYATHLLRLDDPFTFWNDIPFGGYARVDPTSGTLLEGFH